MDTGILSRLETYRSRYARLRQSWVPSTTRYQSWVAACLSNGYRILDLGCGRGGIVERLGDVGKWIGADPDVVSLQSHRRPSLPRCCAPSARLPFASESFDVIAASWVLEHLPTPATTFREIARLLRPGGRFLLLTPNRRHPLPRLSRAVARLRPVQQPIVSLVYKRQPADTFPVTYRANSARDIEHLATDAGLRLSRLEWVEDPSYLAWSTSSFVAAMILDLLQPGKCRVHLVGELVKA